MIHLTYCINSKYILGIRGKFLEAGNYREGDPLSIKLFRCGHILQTWGRD